MVGAHSDLGKGFGDVAQRGERAFPRVEVFVVPVRVRVEAGGSDDGLPESRLVFTDSNGAEQTIYLPAITLGPGGEQCFWISATGSSYLCTENDTEPDSSMLARGAPVSWRTLQPGYKIEVVATYCRGSSPLTQAAGTVSASGADDPEFRQFIRQLMANLLPTQNPERPRGGADRLH